MRFLFADCELDLGSYELRRSGQRVPVEPLVLNLLCQLMHTRGRVATRDELLDALWSGQHVTDGSLTRAVREARRALGDTGQSQEIIRTVRGRGYQWVAPVRELRGEMPEATRPGDANEDLFVGRERLLEDLSVLLARAVAGRGGLALLTGEAGIGKTCVTQRIAAIAREEGAEILVGRCLEGDGAPAFWPWRQATRALLNARDDAALTTLVGPLAVDLGVGLPELRERMPDLPSPSTGDASHARFHFFDAVARVLGRAARSRPLLLVLEDLHKADLPSLELLRFVTREVSQAPLLVIGTARDTELATDRERADLLADLVREPGGSLISIEGFDAAEVARFIEVATGRPASESLAGEIQDRTGGNPYFVALLATRRQEAQPSPTPLARPLPLGLRQAIRRQLGAIEPETQEILKVAAVVGRDFTLPVLLTATGRPIEEVLRHLDEAVRARVVISSETEPGSYHFFHALVCEALYDDLNLPERLDLHRRVGEALEAFYGARVDDHLPELAHHFRMLVAAGEAKRAIAYARRAAERDASALAYENAADHLQHAVDAARATGAEDDLLCDLLLRLGEMETYAGSRSAAREAFREAAALARAARRPLALARAALGFAAEEEEGTVVPERIALLEEALAALDPEDSPLRVRVQSRLAHALYFSEQPERRLALGSEVVTMARRVGDAHALAQTLSDYHWVLTGSAAPEVRLGVGEEMVDLARKLGDHELEGRGLICCLEDLLELGRIDGVDEAIERVGFIADQIRMPHLTWLNTHHRAMRSLLAGRFDEAERRMSEALALGLRASNGVALQFYGIQLWVLRKNQGRLGELEAQVRELAARYPENTGWRSALAYFDVQEGRRDSARAMLVGVLDGSAKARSDLNWLVAASLLSEVCFHLGDREHARVLYGALEPRSEAVAVAGLSMAAIAPVARALGLCAATLGRVKSAESWLEKALTSCEHMAALPMVADLQLDRAQLLARSDRIAARRAAERALELAGALGMRRVESVSRRTIDALG